MSYPIDNKRKKMFNSKLQKHVEKIQQSIEPMIKGLKTDADIS